MSVVRYVGPFDHVEIPALDGVVVARGATVEVPDVLLAGFAGQVDTWEIVSGGDAE